MAAIALVLFSCSTDGLMPTASVDSTNRVGAIGPLELEGPVGAKNLGYQGTASPVASAHQVTANNNPGQIAESGRRLPIIDSEEADNLNTSMGVQPLRAPEDLQDQSVQVASANIAESGTRQPVVDGIGTDSPQLLATSSDQSGDSNMPITWSDQPSIGHDPEQAPVSGQSQGAEQRLAFIPKNQSPIVEPDIAPDVEPQDMPLQMTSADIQCRRDLKKMGVQFEDLPTISDSPVCGIAHPVSVRGFDNGRIKLTPTATLNCEVTLQFAKWVRNELVPSARLRYWSGVKSIRQMSSYSCRRMNSNRNNPWSEHAKGNAIDVGTITLNNGHEIDVEKKGLFSFKERGLLNAVRDDSCKYFDTVLGPGSDPNHKDHFHFDLRERRGGRKHCD